MDRTTTARYTTLLIEDNRFTHLPEFDAMTEQEARDKAGLLTQAMRDTAKAEARKASGRYVAVRTLDSLDRNTNPTDLTVTDLRWLAGETVDRCDFFCAAPEWATKAVDGVAERRNFTPQYIKHVLAAIRCILSVERQMCRQVERHEASMAKGDRRNG